MIHYQLNCDSDHAFDGWFKDSSSFDHQATTGLIACPKCNSVKVSRALMAPALGRTNRHAGNLAVAENVATAPKPASPGGIAPRTPQSSSDAVVQTEMPDKLRSLLQRLRADVEKQCDYVGPAFAEEARRIHYGETKAHGIYGETTSSEAASLAEEGIDFGIVP